MVLIADEEVPGKERVKILDFGLARFLDSPERRTTAGVALGTPTYMSPEQCMGDELDGKSDVYTLGVILYELLADQVPFPGDEMGKVMRQHVDQQPRQVRERNPQLPVEVAALAHSMLEKRREQRPDMRQVAQRIEDLENAGKLGPTSGAGAAAAAAATGPRADAPTMASPVQKRPAAPATELVRRITRPKMKPQFIGGLLGLGLATGLGVGLGVGTARTPPAPHCPPAIKCPEPSCPAPPETPPATSLKADPGTAPDPPKPPKKKGKAKKTEGSRSPAKKSR